jgi:hypothetical protein
MNYQIQSKDQSSNKWEPLEKFTTKEEADRKHSWYVQYGGKRSFRVVKA